MFLRHIAIGLTPSFIVDAVRRRKAMAAELQRRERERLEREKIEAAEAAKKATSWEDACARAGSYAADYVNRFRVMRGAGYIPDGSFLRANILAIAARSCDKTGMEITDLGGSTGELGADLLLRYPHSHYTVVENETLVELMTKERLRSEIFFSTTLPETCDIFYTSGTLQYLEDPMDTLGRGFKSARHAAILRRNNFSEIEKFDIQTSRLHHNGAGPVPANFPDQEISYPRRTLVEAQIVSLARSEGFELVAGLSGDDGAGEGNYGKQLVFWRNASRN